MNARSPNPLILIVDDDPTVRLIATEVLGMNGFRTETAKDGHEAMAVIPSLAPDVVMIDLSMPGENGIDICKALRRAGSRVPVVVMSGWVDDDILKRSRDAGVMECIRKPPDWMALVEKLRNIVRAARPAPDTPPEPS